jgi:transcriptional regulator with XRE-family HTH domain
MQEEIFGKAHYMKWKEGFSMLTRFGKFCRKLRIDKGELLKDMSIKLSVTPSYLSAVENGKRNIPKEWTNYLIRLYSLNDIERLELIKATEESLQNIKVDLKGLHGDDKNLMMALARDFKDLDAEEKDSLKQILLRFKKR